jgi:putative endonuclease
LTVAPRRRAGTGVRTPKQRAGDAAEEAACRHLVENGCRIVARNVRYKFGELDIVAVDGDELVFVEVRLRSSAAYGGAAASIDVFKQKRLVMAARQYLATHHAAPTQRAPNNAANYAAAGAGARRRTQLPPCRFDVITADGNGVIDWLRGAFGA